MTTIDEAKALLVPLTEQLDFYRESGIKPNALRVSTEVRTAMDVIFDAKIVTFWGIPVVLTTFQDHRMLFEIV